MYCYFPQNVFPQNVLKKKKENQYKTKKLPPPPSHTLKESTPPPSDLYSYALPTELLGQFDDPIFTDVQIT